MKKIIAALSMAAAVALTGCAATNTKLNDTRTLVLEGKPTEVKVEPIKSFQVEIAPRKAVCKLLSAQGNLVDAECLQYRQTFNKNYISLAGEIEGFTYEPGYRYVLDLTQTPLVNEKTGEVIPKWTLNKIVSKTAEAI